MRAFGSIGVLAWIFFVLHDFRNISSLRVMPEGTNITYFNKKYVERAFSELHHYGTGHYINVGGCTKHTWTNNVTFHVIFFEYKNNVYRRSFTEVHFKFCDLVNSDPYIGQVLIKAGLACPARSGEYRLMNMTVPAMRFPNVWPFKKGRFDIEAVHTVSGEIIAQSYLAMSFKQN